MTRIAALLALLLLPAGALAQGAEEEIDPETGRPIHHALVTEVDFREREVRGQIVRPSGILVMPREAAVFKPLIELRQDFDPEMRSSVDLVK